MGLPRKAGADRPETVFDAERRVRPRGHEGPAYLIAPVCGVVTDLGTGGFCVEAWEPLVVKRRYFMLIGETAERAARLACRVEWCRLVRAEKHEDGDVVSIYRLGVSYLGLEERRSMRA